MEQIMSHQFTGETALRSQYVFDLKYFQNQELKILLSRYNRLNTIIYIPAASSLSTDETCPVVIDKAQNNRAAIKSRDELISKNSDLLVNCQNYQNIQKEITNLASRKDVNEQKLKGFFYTDLTLYPHREYLAFYGLIVLPMPVAMPLLFGGLIEPVVTSILAAGIVALSIAAVLFAIGSAVLYYQVSSSKKPLKDDNCKIQSEIDELQKNISELDKNIQSASSISKDPAVRSSFFPLQPSHTDNHVDNKTATELSYK